MATLRSRTAIGLIVDAAFLFVPGSGLEHEFETGAAVHLHDTDINQEIYGLSAYMSALHSAQLNRSATLFRRKYYDNDSHAGFILYMTDANQEQKDMDEMRKA